MRRGERRRDQIVQIPLEDAGFARFFAEIDLDEDRQPPLPAGQKPLEALHKSLPI